MGAGFAATLCRDWEEAAAKAKSPQTRVVHLRIGNVLSKQGGMLDSLRPIYRARLGGVLGRGTQPFVWVSLVDLVGLIRHVADHGECSGPVNAVAPASSTQRDLHRALQAAFGRQLGVPVPSWGIHGLLGEAGRLLTEGAPVVPQVALESGFVFQDRDLVGAVGDLRK